MAMEHYFHYDYDYDYDFDQGGRICAKAQSAKSLDLDENFKS